MKEVKLKREEKLHKFNAILKNVYQESESINTLQANSKQLLSM